MQARRWHHFLWQPALAIAVICLLLFLFNRFAASDILWAVGAGSLASSCCLVFGSPSSQSASVRCILGGYAIGILSGELVRLLLLYFGITSVNFLAMMDAHWIGLLASISVGLSILLMSFFRFQHPPAVGMSLVLVLDLRDYRTLAVVVIGAVLVATLRVVFAKKLADLV